MSVSALPPTAPTTLVIELGASTWPNSPGFQASRAFMHAAQGFRDYLLDPHSFGLPAVNLLDLFDAASSASDQLEQVGSFLEERTEALKAANQPVRDVIVYFVGHGGFAGSSADFYLLPRRANTSSLRASGMAIDALAEVLREKARQTRRYLFLDCCFAAAAFRSFQGGPDQTAITKTLDAFTVQARSSGFPRRGTVLLCSSDQKSPSLLLPDESCTMFSHALLDVLKNGDLHRPHQLSLRDIKELAEDRLAALPEKNAPRPGLHSPDQSEGDVADVPFFPNLRPEEERRRQAQEAEQARKMKEEKRRQAEEEHQAEQAERARLLIRDRAFNTPSPPQGSAMQPQHPWDAGNTGPDGVGWQPNTPLGDQSSSTPPASMSSDQSGQKDSIVGEAHYIQHRHEAQQGNIFTFRVERYDRDGNRLQPVPVEMRGYSITGFINEGDQVRVSGEWRGGLLRATRADNVTTGAEVVTKGVNRALIALGVVVAGIIIAGLILVALMIIFNFPR